MLMALLDQLKTGKHPSVNQQFKLQHFIQWATITVKSTMAMLKNMEESDKFNTEPKQSRHKIQAEFLLYKIKELARPIRGVRSQGSGLLRAEGSSSHSEGTSGFARILGTLPSLFSSV